MKEEQEKTFCRECGSPLVIHLRNKWNEYSGERLIGKHCPNLNCEEGCGYEGHKMQLFTDRCKRCSYVICDY